MTLLDRPCMVSLLGIQRVTETLIVHSLGFPVTIAAEEIAVKIFKNIQTA